MFDYRIYRAESALADKLLAMVEVHDGRPSSRVKDLVDVVVYAKACRIDSRTLAEQVANESRARKVNLPERFQIPDAWPAVYGRPYAKMARQAKVDDVAPDMVSAEELAAKLYEPALGTHWKHGASTWSPSSLIWLQQKETTPWSQTTTFPIAPRHKTAEASQAHAKRLFLIKQMHH